MKFPYVWMDGKFVKWKDANVHILTHALHYGTAIFEGIRCYNTKKGPAVFRLDDHLQRMFDGLKIYDFPMPYSCNAFRQAVIDTLKKNKADIENAAILDPDDSYPINASSIKG